MHATTTYYLLKILEYLLFLLLFLVYHIHDPACISSLFPSCSALQGGRNFLLLPHLRGQVEEEEEIEILIPEF